MRTQAFASALALALILHTVSLAQGEMPRPVKSGYAKVNGLELYYEIHGKGRPLVLLHGAFMTIPSNWKELIPDLSKNHQVIAVELQGHGRTKDIDRPYSFESLADDVAALLKQLGRDSADVIGYSMGGGVAQQLTIRHPALVRKLVIISAVYKFEGWYPEGQAAFPNMNVQMFVGTPLETEYAKVAPDPSQFIPFVTKMLEWIKHPYDFGVDNIKAISAPRLIIIGDSDGVQPEHAVEMFRLAGGGKFGDLGVMPESRLAIYPATTHVGVMMHTDWLMENIGPFLSE